MLKAYEEQSQLFQALRNTEYEPFIRSLIQEFEQNSYQENLQSLTNISSDLAAMKETTLVFYETLKDNKVIKESQTILKEKN